MRDMSSALEWCRIHGSPATKRKRCLEAPASDSSMLRRRYKHSFSYNSPNPENELLPIDVEMLALHRALVKGLKPTNSAGLFPLNIFLVSQCLSFTTDELMNFEPVLCFCVLEATYAEIKCYESDDVDDKGNNDNV